MQKNFLFKYLILFCLLTIFSAHWVWAGLKLQQQYPEIPGVVSSLNQNIEEAQAKKSQPTIPSLIGYILSWIMILSIMIATVSLIVAGVQYLNSFGKKEAMKNARLKIIKAFIGLTILFSAYIILGLVQPSIQLPTIQKRYVAADVILFSQEGYNDFFSSTHPLSREYIDDLATQRKVIYFGSQWPDVEKELGVLQQGANNEKNFEQFNWVGLGLIGSGAKKIKVLTFKEKNFNQGITDYNINQKRGMERWYTTEGIFNGNGEKIPNSDPNQYLVGSEKLYYFDLQNFTENNGSQPPLSIALTGIGPGIYLYSQKPETRKIEGVDVYLPSFGTQRYLEYDCSDFSDSGFAFDNMATEIEIKNHTEQNPDNDLLAVLFNDPNYKGSFRLFFEKRDISVPNLYYERNLNNKDNDLSEKFEEETPSSSGEAPEAGIVVFRAKSLSLSKIKQLFCDNNGVFSQKSITVGNVEQQKKKTTINNTDAYGFVQGVSSARIFNLAKKIEDNTCKEVRLCNQENLQGYCLSYTPQGKRVEGLYNALTLPMPWFFPVPIPSRLIASKNDYLEGGWDAAHSLLGYSNSLFANNIRSLGIDGNCLVALFENSLKKSIKDCLTMGEQKDCWENDKPGEKSQIFSPDDMIYKTDIAYINLTNQPIGQCVKRVLRIQIARKPCASAIAVFPLKY